MKFKNALITLLIAIFITILVAIFLLPNKGLIKTSNNKMLADNTSIIQQNIELGVIKEETATLDNFYYKLIDEENIKLITYLGNADSLIIPSEIEGSLVQKLYSDAFDSNQNLEIIKISKEVKIPAEIDNFELNTTFSTEDYYVYTTTKEYNEEYLNYLQLSDEEKECIELVPEKFVKIINIGTNNESGINPNGIVEIPKSYTLLEESTYNYNFNKYGNITLITENQENFLTCWSYAMAKSIESNIELNHNYNIDVSEAYLATMTGLENGHLVGMNTYCFQKGKGPVGEIENTVLEETYIRQNNTDEKKAVYHVLTNNHPIEEKLNTARNIMDKYTQGTEYYIMEPVWFEGRSKIKEDGGETAVNEMRNKLKQHIMKYGSIYACVSAPAQNGGDNRINTIVSGSRR